MAFTSDRSEAQQFNSLEPVKLGASSGRAPDGPQGRRPILLVVEDDEPTLSALRRLFTRLGWDVHSAMTIAVALEKLSLEPEGIVLDLMLPDGDGLAVLRRVRATGASARVVVTTGVDDPRRLDEVRLGLPDALLRKPVDIQDLIRALDLRSPSVRSRSAGR